MKNFLLLFTVIFFVACEGPMGPAGPPGKDGYDAIPDKIDLYVKKEHWVLKSIIQDGVEVGTFYECIMKAPEITTDVYTWGAIVCYYFYTDVDVEVQTPLPFTFYDSYYDGTYDVPYSLEYSFNITPGEIAFKAYVNDLDGRSIVMNDCHFRLVWMY